MAKNRIDVMIVDDHQMVRTTIGRMLSKHADVNIVAEANDGVEAVELAAKHKPRIIIMDVRMPKMDGIQASKQIMKEFPKTRIVVLTGMPMDCKVLSDLITTDVAAILMKQNVLSELISAVVAVDYGGLYLCQNMTDMLKNCTSHSSKDASVKLATLTKTEMSVYEYFRKGMPSKDIAKKLSVSSKTIDKHKRNIRKKFGVSTNEEMVDILLN